MQESDAKQAQQEQAEFDQAWKDRLVFLCILAISVLLHVVLLVPTGVALIEPDDWGFTLESSLTHEPDADPDEPEEEDQNEIEPGIDAETKPTLTWIGDKEYREHIARRAEFEQKENQLDKIGEETQSAGADAVSPTNPSTPSIAAAPSEATKPVETPLVVEREVVQAVAQAKPTETSESTQEEQKPFANETPERPEPEKAATELGVRQGPLPLTPYAGVFAQLLQFGAKQKELVEAAPSVTQGEDAKEVAAIARAKPAEPPEKPPEKPTEEPQEKPKEQNAKPAVDPAKPTPATPAAGENAKPKGRQTDGKPDDRESDATSIEWKKVKSGAPIARQGLVIQPVKPKFTSLERVWGGKLYNRSVEVIIAFRNTGVPDLERTRIVKGTSDSKLNARFLDSIRNWTARGEKIDALGDDEVIQMSFTIVPIG